MNLNELKKHWHEFGKKDPMWAILTLDDKKGQHWDTVEFFARGKEEIAVIMARVESLNLTLNRGKSLDFGCGVGRLTQALAHYFDESYGVDIAPSMIETARRLNQHGEKCQYFLNDQNDLRLFADETFDFIYSVIVLQHMQPTYSRQYIKEFFRVLAPGGVLVFQIPSELKVPEGTLETQSAQTSLSAIMAQLANYYHRLKNRIVATVRRQPFKPKMEMYGIPKDEMVRFIELHGGKVLDFVDDGWCGPQWTSYTYFVEKENAGDKK